MKKGFKKTFHCAKTKNGLRFSTQPQDLQAIEEMLQPYVTLAAHLKTHEAKLKAILITQCFLRLQQQPFPMNGKVQFSINRAEALALHMEIMGNMIYGVSTWHNIVLQLFFHSIDKNI
jgi:hypothetical protein